MKVLHVLPFPGVGGTEIATRRIIDGTRGLGVDSAVLPLQPTAELDDYLRSAGIARIAAEAVPEPGLRHPLRFLRHSARAAAMLRRQKIDLLHCADVDAAYHLAVAGRLAGIPVLSQVRNRQTRWTRRERMFLDAATHFAFVSKATRAQCVLKVADSRASVVYDGIDIAGPEVLARRASVAASVRAEFGWPADAEIVAMFARVNPQKDYETLAQAAALLCPARPRLHFLVVGDHASVAGNRAFFDTVREQVAAAGVADRFLFAGFRADTQRLMLAADLCVLSTHFEGLPLVILEAMALARPCVATDVDGIPEAITHERTGLLTKRRDAAGLAAALGRLLQRPEAAARLGRQARDEVAARFGRDRFEREMHALYVRLAARRRPLRL